MNAFEIKELERGVFFADYRYRAFVENYMVIVTDAERRDDQDRATVVFERPVADVRSIVSIMVFLVERAPGAFYRPDDGEYAIAPNRSMYGPAITI